MNINQMVFGEEAHNPRTWCHQAELLWQSAEVLYAGSAPAASGEPRARCPLTRSPELMLRGLAIECFLKCVLIATERSWTKASANLGILAEKGIHRLQEIVPDGVFALTLDERRLCELLTEFIRWRGRYPTALKWSPSSDAEWTVDDDVKLSNLHARCLTAANAYAEEREREEAEFNDLYGCW